MILLENLKAKLFELIKNDNKPIVVYSSIWPFIVGLNMPRDTAAKSMLAMLLDLAGNNRSLLMPTFSKGYNNGICNLDTEPSTTGVISELFRQNKSSIRTLSAFFSFNVIGPDANQLSDLKSKHAFGENSIYEWMEQNDVHFIMLGVDPSHCSYLHRCEWLIRDKINYRFNKAFKGTIIRNGNQIGMEENLYVRVLNPEVINDFTTLTPGLVKAGMKLLNFEKLPIAYMNALNMKHATMSQLELDPYKVLKNRSDFENKEIKHE